VSDVQRLKSSVYDSNLHWPPTVDCQTVRKTSAKAPCIEGRVSSLPPSRGVRPVMGTQKAGRCSPVIRPRLAPAHFRDDDAARLTADGCGRQWSVLREAWCASRDWPKWPRMLRPGGSVEMAITASSLGAEARCQIRIPTLSELELLGV
jgi:hypothetical protein